MGRFDTVQTSFTAGELSPRIRGRIDFARFFDGAALLQNYVVLPQGGAFRRPGTRFIAEVKTSGSTTRLIPFEFSDNQTYVIELGDGYARFYTNGGRLESGGSPVELTTPWTAAQLNDVMWAQSADILYLAHPSVRPQEIRRTSSTTFTVTDHDFRDGPWLDTNTTSTTLTPSGTSGSVTITASSTTGINDNQGFLSTDVGRHIRFQDSGGKWVWYIITARNSATSVTADTKRSPDTTTASSTWALGAWSDTTGWPRTVTSHNGRLWWGSTTTQPQTVWASRAGNFRSHAVSDSDGTVADDHAINVTIDSAQVNGVAFMVPASQGVFCGTTGGEFTIQPASTTKGISPTNVEVRPETSRGARRSVMPAVIGRSIVFVQRDGVELREAAFDFNVDGYTEQSLTVLSEHLFRSKIWRLAYQQAPVSVLWAITDDGKLRGLTFEKQQKVFGWHQHVIGGSGTVLDITSIPGSGQNELWLLVRRTINGATKDYVEQLSTYFDDTTDTLEDAFFLDSGLTGTFGSPITTVTGLGHLEGETVQILADGGVLPDETVSGGQITLDVAASKVHVGYASPCIIETLPIEAGQQGQTTTGKMRRIHQAHIKLLSSVGLEAGGAAGLEEILPFRSTGDRMDEAVPLFTGVKSFPLRSRFGREASIRVRNQQPLPSHILSIGLDMQVGDS